MPGHPTLKNWSIPLRLLADAQQAPQGSTLTEASMKNAAANCEKSSLVPAEIQTRFGDLFGDPALLRSEDPAIYNTLLNQIAEHVEPKDIVEWWWVKDIADHNWEIRRLRRFKALFVEIRRDEWVQNRAMFATLRADEDAPYVPEPVPVGEQDSAQLFMHLIGEYQSVDRLIASAEARRDRTLREIERRRKETGRRLREASEKIDRDVDELPQAAE